MNNRKFPLSLVLPVKVLLLYLVCFQPAYSNNSQTEPQVAVFLFPWHDLLDSQDAKGLEKFKVDFFKSQNHKILDDRLEDLGIKLYTYVVLEDEITNMEWNETPTKMRPAFAKLAKKWYEKQPKDGEYKKHKIYVFTLYTDRDWRNDLGEGVLGIANFRDHANISSRGSPDTYVHEVGHNLSLSHKDGDILYQNSWWCDSIMWYDYASLFRSDCEQFTSASKAKLKAYVATKYKFSGEQQITWKETDLNSWTTQTAGRAWIDWNQNGKIDFCAVRAKHLICSERIKTGEVVIVIPVVSKELDPGWGNSRFWTDFNGDGFIDFCSLIGADTKIQCVPTLAQDDTDKVKFGDPIVSSKAIDGGWEDGRAWVDFNGDGKTDYCRVVDNTKLRCSLSPEFSKEITSDQLDAGWNNSRFWVDINNDDMFDFCSLVGSPDTKISCTLSKGSEFGETIESESLDGGWPDGRGWGDFNGDGYPDYCRVTDQTKLVCTLVVYEAGAVTFGDSIETDIDDAGWNDSRYWTDFNGDGRMDYCRLTGRTRIVCTLSDGDSFGQEWTSHHIEESGDVDGRAWKDANGDGYKDFLRVSGSAAYSSITMISQ